MVVSSNISESQLPQEKESISVKEATSNHPIYTKKNDSIDLVKIDSKQSLSKVKEPYNVKEDTSRPSLDSVNHDHVGIIANNPKKSFVVMPKTIETTQALRSTEKIDSGLVQGTAGLSNGTVEELKPVKDLQQEDKLAQSTAEPIINSESINQERLTRPLKRARTAYFIFQDEKRPQVQAEHKGQSIGIIARAIGQLWSKLNPEEKRKYQLQSTKEREQVSIQMQELKKLGLLPNPHMSDENERSVSGIGEGMILPVARIRKICRLDPEVRGMSKEAVNLVTKAAEKFIHKLGKEAVMVAQMQNRRKLLPEDVAEVCTLRDPFFFLKDDIRDLVKKQVDDKKSQKLASNEAGVNGSLVSTAGIKPLTSYYTQNT